MAFAQGVHNDLGYAFKFFVDRGSFIAERDMYRSQTLGLLLPQVLRCTRISTTSMHDTLAASCQLLDALRCHAPVQSKQNVL